MDGLCAPDVAEGYLRGLADSDRVLSRQLNELLEQIRQYGPDAVASALAQAYAAHAFGADYTTLLAGIRTRAGSPRIVVLNVPNPAGLPYLAGTSLAQRQAGQRVAVAMTKTVVNPLLSSNIAVVDLMCDSRSYIPSNYSSDGLHPNDAGYAYIASEVVKAITSGSYPAPQSSCSAMTIVP